MGISYYFQIENSAATYTYLIVAYGWAIACTLLSRKILITSLDIWTGILVTIIIFGYIVNSGIVKQLVFVILLALNYLFGRHIQYAQLPSLFKSIFAVGVLTIALSLHELPSFFRGWTTSVWRPELYGNAAYASAFAYFMGFLFIITIGWVVPNSRRKFISIFLLLLVSLIIIYSSARIVIVSCAFVLLILLYYHASMSLRKKLFTVTFSVALALTTWTILPENYKEFNSLDEDSGIILLLTEPLDTGDTLSLRSDESDFLTQNTLGMRIQIIRSCLVEYFKSPIFGYGPDRLFIPHNAFLQVLFEHGIIAGVILASVLLKILFLMFRFIKHANKIARSQLVLLLSMFIYTLLYISVMGTTLTMNTMFFFMGVMVSLVTDVAIVALVSNNGIRKP